VHDIGSVASTKAAHLVVVLLYGFLYVNVHLLQSGTRIIDGLHPVLGLAHTLSVQTVRPLRCLMTAAIDQDVITLL